jgi:hypothetical protein
VQDLETNLGFLLRPYQRALVDPWPRPRPARMASFFTGADGRERMPMLPASVRSPPTKDFLTLWKDADPDIPILKQAKAEYARLQ